MSRVQVVAVAWLAFVVGLIAVQALFPQRSGVLALTEVFEPYIAITALVAAVMAVRASSNLGRILALLLVGVLLVRCVPTLVSNPGPGLAYTPLNVMSWNVLAKDAAERSVDAVTGAGLALVGLQELQPDAAAALADDPEVGRQFPYQALEPDASVRGLGLLSAMPILEHSVSADPPFMRAVVRPSFGDPIVVYVVHPLPARVQTAGGIPFALDTSKRDADITLIRQQIDLDLAAGKSVIVMGDLNTTEREPAYAEISAGMGDAHLDAGVGPGLTWRPESLAFLPFGLLRIDYIFVSPGLHADTVFVDCFDGSDHCAVKATIYNGASDI
jgi:vancomycin resistance protein VanJ